MARIRTIKPDFFRHEGLYEAEVETGLPLRVGFAGLWTAADREGRFKWLPRQLKLDALPYDEVDFSRVLDALMTRGHIVKYTIDGVVYGCIPSWESHQIVNNRETPSDIPAPTDSSIESTGSTREPRVNNATGTPLCNYQGEGKGKEGKGREGEGDTPRAARKSTPSFPRPDDVSEQVWSDWCALRAKKRTTVSETVIGEARSEAALAGIPLERFLSIWVARGSQGLCADWLKPSERHPGSRTAPTQDRAAINAEAARMLGFNDDEVFDAQS